MIQKKRKFFKQKDVFKIFSNSCNVEILNYFNPKLELKDTESAIKSKLIDLLAQL